MTPLEAARWWVKYRIHVIPAPFATKHPILKGWQELRLDASSPLEEYFNGERMNIAILLGPENLTDVDIDTGEALWAWQEYAIPTGMCWGHRSKRASHWLYYTEPAAATLRYLDPAADKEKEDKACIIEIRCMGAGGKPGLVTMGPPSMHPSGEPYEFEGGKAGSPAKVAKEVLEKAVRYTFVAALLGRHAPADGSKHQFFLDLAGAFARADWPLEEAVRLARAVYRVIWHEQADLTAAEREVESTYQRFGDGHDITGLRHLIDSELLDQRVWRRMTQLLRLATGPQAVPAKPRRALPESESIDDLRERAITMPHTLVEQCLISPGLTLLASGSKNGKSVLAMQILMSVANNLSFLGRYDVRQASALIVEWDDLDAEASLKDFVLKARASRGEQPLRVIYQQPSPPLTIADPEFLPWLKRQILKDPEHPIGLVVLDSYTALRGFHGGKDIVKLEAEELTKLAHLAQEVNSAILLIHHDSKSSAHLDRYNRAGGSYGMRIALVGHLTLERFRSLPENHNARLLSIQGRKLDGVQMVIRFVKDSLDYDFVMAGPASEDYPRLCQLWSHFGAMNFTVKDVQSELGWTRSLTYELLARFTNFSILRKESKATWTWDANFQGRNLL